MARADSVGETWGGRIVSDLDAADSNQRPARRHRILRICSVVVAAVICFGVVTLYTGFAPLHLASASDLIDLRDRINANASCPGGVPAGKIAEINWLSRSIRLKHDPGLVPFIPEKANVTPQEEYMLGPGPHPEIFCTVE